MDEPKLNQRVLYWVIGVSGVIALAGILYLGDRTPTEDARTCEVTGVVTDASGTALPTFELAVLTTDKKKTLRHILAEKRNDGAFGFTIDVGEYVLTCQAAGCAPHEAPFLAVSPSVHLKIVMQKRP